MEEEVFYPRLRDEQKVRDNVLEGLEEHHVADVILDELLDVPPDSDLWKAKVKVLKENVEHHMDEEEDELLKNAKRVLDRDELNRLGERMERIKRDAEDSD
jgi:hemerythrin-like domain-containing protein